jgi:hypothetical protein
VSILKEIILLLIVNSEVQAQLFLKELLTRLLIVLMNKSSPLLSKSKLLLSGFTELICLWLLQQFPKWFNFLHLPQVLLNAGHLFIVRLAPQRVQLVMYLLPQELLLERF